MPFPPPVSAKLHTMRKPQEFSVRPTSDGRIYIQSDKSCGIFDFRTGKGRLSVKGPYFPNLSYDGFDYEYPAEFIKACLAVCPALGSETTVGGCTFVNTVEVF